MPFYFRGSHGCEAFILVLALGGLYWFAASFFLAKQSISHVSDCNEAATLLQDQLQLTPQEASRAMMMSNHSGCWMDRNVDSIVILLVDALRFDFAYYQLPLSIGRRLSHDGQHSHLYQFLADPPTVTMQRIKALTTGSLPTFADISGSFGGAQVAEDTWMGQLVGNDQRIGFVGDDTWVDLFAADQYFDVAYPYPSFNTRDIDTVDNGCQKHLPELLPRLRRRNAATNDTTMTNPPLDLLIVHFLGVDHVGHTYGPNNVHMDAKLKAMDSILETVLETVDSHDDSCHAVLIFGDHGMTEDGNHGGGTTEETNAALFVHTTPSCATRNNNAQQLEQHAVSLWVKDTLFTSMHQIDLVPTIALLLGIPIPYSNLGGIVPSILPGSAPQTTLALALNAAQVWRYYAVYSQTANRLPNLDRLQDQLDLAVGAYQQAIRNEKRDETEFLEASAMFKTFLNEALELGQRVWTRFDDTGMVLGFVVLSVAALLFAGPILQRNGVPPLPVSHYWEYGVAALFLLFQCGLKSFSNSYVLEEENAIMYFLTILSLLVGFRVKAHGTTLWRGICFIPVASRLGELLVSGHGLDPSIRAHSAHHAVVFLTSLALMGSFRWFLYQRRIVLSKGHLFADCLALFLLGWGWLEKRRADPDRNGFWPIRIVLVLVLAGIPTSLVQAALRYSGTATSASDILTVVSKFLIAIMTVTGPSTATSVVLYLFQVSIIILLSYSTFQTQPLVLCSLLRCITRHTFFSTNHGCAFNRLQYTAAFVATSEFVYEIGGISLFLNTFGWEMVGLLVVYVMGRDRCWKLYTSIQLVEAAASCVAVAVLRRHLMVWDIYAPHFLFASIFTILHLLAHLTVLPLTISS